ncbi:hypothetical protein NC651_017088 [Populus alba x Populus x berolinensis]|nr:hypothetical protein NC651_017088 [Populus alba x Populus x berolinensis]
MYLRTDIVMFFLDMDLKTKPLLLNLLIIMKITSMIMEMDFYILVTREPGPVKGGITIIAFVEDPMATSLSSWKEA